MNFNKNKKLQQYIPYVIILIIAAASMIGWLLYEKPTIDTENSAKIEVQKTDSKDYLGIDSLLNSAQFENLEEDILQPIQYEAGKRNPFEREIKDYDN